jgi:hypothetical protein
MGRAPNKPKSRRNAGESEIMMPKGIQWFEPNGGFPPFGVLRTTKPLILVVSAISHLKNICLIQTTSARTSPPIWTHAAPTPGPQRTGSGMRSGTITKVGPIAA